MCWCHTKDRNSSPVTVLVLRVLCSPDFSPSSRVYSWLWKKPITTHIDLFCLAWPFVAMVMYQQLRRESLTSLSLRVQQSRCFKNCDISRLGGTGNWHIGSFRYLNGTNGMITKVPMAKRSFVIRELELGEYALGNLDLEDFIDSSQSYKNLESH